MNEPIEKSVIIIFISDNFESFQQWLNQQQYDYQITAEYVANIVLEIANSLNLSPNEILSNRNILEQFKTKEPDNDAPVDESMIDQNLLSAINEANFSRIHRYYITKEAVLITQEEHIQRAIETIELFGNTASIGIYEFFQRLNGKNHKVINENQLLAHYMEDNQDKLDSWLISKSPLAHSNLGNIMNWVKKQLNRERILHSVFFPENASTVN